MTKKVVRKFARLALRSSPVVIVVAGLFAALPWLKQQNPMVAAVLSGVAVIFVMGYMLFLGQRKHRRLDEVQIAHQRFANSHGWVWGGMATQLLLLVPPVRNWLVDLLNAVVNMLGARSPEEINHSAVPLALFCGVCLVMLMQSLGVIVAAVIWARRTYSQMSP
jgi:hypothetical protein